MEVEIAPPSPAQMRKLHMGHPFRAKLGPGLKVVVPHKEAKKLMKASMKGSGATLHGCSVPHQFDPFQFPGRGMEGGNVKASAKENSIRLMDAGTDRAVRALEGSGMNPFVKVQRQLEKKRQSQLEKKQKQRIKAAIERKQDFKQDMHRKPMDVSFGGNVKKSAKKNSIRLMDAGTDRAIRALEGSGMEGGKVNRRKKFNNWFKAIGDKFKPIAKNVKPIKEALADRAVDAIKYYNNPQAQAQAMIDMGQAEYKDTRKLGKKRSASMGSASVANDSYESLRRGTFVQPEPPPPPQAIDVNDDGEPDGYFYPNELAFFGAGKTHKEKQQEQLRKKFRYNESHDIFSRRTNKSSLRRNQSPPKYTYKDSKGHVITKEQYEANQAALGPKPGRPGPPARGGMMGRPTIMPVVGLRPTLKASGAKKSSPWIEHVKGYASQHGVKYGEALKLAKATYKKGMVGKALYPAGLDPRYDL